MPESASGVPQRSLYQGDCLAVLARLPSQSVQLVIADLPFGVTANAWDTVIAFEPLWQQLLRVGKQKAAFLFFATQPFATALINSQPKLFRYDLIWHKTGRPSGHLNAKHRPLSVLEQVLIFGRSSGSVYNPQMTPYAVPRLEKPSPEAHRSRVGSSNWKEPNRAALCSKERIYTHKYPTNLLVIPRVAVRNVHPTQKPVALLEWLIKTYSNPGDTILDPTMGSGTAGVACANTGRQFVGIELDPGYFAIARERIGEAKHRQALRERRLGLALAAADALRPPPDSAINPSL